MDNFSVENVLMDLAMGLPAAVMECDSPEYEIGTDESGNFIFGNEMTLIAPTGQRFVVSVVEEK